jgi:peptidylprolyl isomerase
LYSIQEYCVSQPNRPRKGTPPETRSNPALGAIAALIVIGIFVALGFMLAGRANPVAVPTAVTEPFAVETPVDALPTVEAAPTVAAVTANDPASRNGKYPAAPPMTIDAAKSYVATITTPRGDIVIQLRPDLAPQTVNSFVFLAREGYFDGVTWHRVIPGFVAQGGDPTGTGAGGPGYSIPGEFTDQVLFDRPGLVAMARTDDPNSGGSQFFITLGPTENLNNSYAIFGEVTQGLDIVNAIPARDPGSAQTPGEQMLKVTITEQ